MTTLIVHLDGSLTQADINRVVGAVEQIRGVLGVEGAAGAHQSSRSSEQHHQAGYQAPRGGEASFDPRQARPGAGPGQHQPSRPASQDVDLTERTQRRFISQSLKWGVHNGKVSLERLSGMTPEENIKLALELADQMSDDEKRSLANEIQNN